MSNVPDLNALIAAAIPVNPPDEWFENPMLDHPHPIKVTPDGHVYGHVAAWDMDHIGMPFGTRPPRSRSGYAYFRTGELETASGSLVPVGQLTLAGGHAGLEASAAEAVKHYDDTASAIADVAAGEDAYGIWVSGALRPNATPEQVRALRASAPSGDWRQINGRLEMVAVCQVNVPGFPVARSRVASGAPMSLVAAGTAPLLAQLAIDPAYLERLAQLEAEEEAFNSEQWSLAASAAKTRVDAARQERLRRDAAVAAMRVRDPERARQLERTALVAAGSREVPPKSARDAMERALKWVADGKGGDGLEPATVRRARAMMKGTKPSDATIKRMASFFARHKVDSKADGWNSGSEAYPSAGRVAWDLWGGDAGARWAAARSEALTAAGKITPNAMYPERAPHDGESVAVSFTNEEHAALARGDYASLPTVQFDSATSALLATGGRELPHGMSIVQFTPSSGSGEDSSSARSTGVSTDEVRVASANEVRNDDRAVSAAVSGPDGSVRSVPTAAAGQSYESAVRGSRPRDGSGARTTVPSVQHGTWSRGSSRNVSYLDVPELGRLTLHASVASLPDGSYPINTVSDLKKAISAYGRAKDQDQARRHIKKRARALKRPDLLPNAWVAAGSFDHLNRGYLSDKADTQERDKFGKFVPENALVRFKDRNGEYRFGKARGAKNKLMQVQLEDGSVRAIRPQELETVLAVLPDDVAPNDAAVPPAGAFTPAVPEGTTSPLRVGELEAGEAVELNLDGKQGVYFVEQPHNGTSVVLRDADNNRYTWTVESGVEVTRGISDAKLDAVSMTAAAGSVVDLPVGRDLTFYAVSSELGWDLLDAQHRVFASVPFAEQSGDDELRDVVVDEYRARTEDRPVLTDELLARAIEAAAGRALEDADSDSDFADDFRDWEEEVERLRADLGKPVSEEQYELLEDLGVVGKDLDEDEPYENY